MNKSGPYKTFMPEVLDAMKGNFFVDYALHVAPIRREHRKELELLADDFGIPSFKIFMFYGGSGLHGKSDDAAQRDFLMHEDDHKYDHAHFEMIMRELHDLKLRRPDLAPHLSLSLHCEFAEILQEYTTRVME